MTEEGFHRQRRNLILMASLVIFINVTGASLKKINLLGNEIDLANPNVMPVILGLVLGYFLLRFVQYAHEIENKGFKDRFLKQAEVYLEPYVLKREHSKNNSNLAKAYPNKNDIRVESLIMFDKAMPRNTAAVSFEPKEHGVVIDENELHISNVELIWPFWKATFHIVFRTKLVTEFVFPPFFALLAYASFYSYFKALLSSWL